MKQKIQKRLSLNKATVANLGKSEQSQVKAGVSGDICPNTYVCPTRLCTDYPATCTKVTYDGTCYYNSRGAWVSFCYPPCEDA